MTDKATRTDDAAVEPAAAARSADRREADGSTPTVNEYTVAFSPRNVAVGLAIVAGLVGLLVRRRRRGKGS